jgi:hypothetical protein
MIKPIYEQEHKVMNINIFPHSLHTIYMRQKVKSLFEFGMECQSILFLV